MAFILRMDKPNLRILCGDRGAYCRLNYSFTAVTGGSNPLGDAIISMTYVIHLKRFMTAQEYAWRARWGARSQRTISESLFGRVGTASIARPHIALSDTQ